MTEATKIAQALLDIKAVTLSPLEPYTWASGLYAPIYCDNRLTISHPEIRTFITNALIETIQTHFPSTQAIVGTATAGIPQAAWVSQAMTLPMAYVRASSKDHGKKNAIEGQLESGTHVVVIEDLISTGKSALAACVALQEAGLIVDGVVSVFTYEMVQASIAFEAANIPVYSLCTFTELIDTATPTLTNDALELLALWSTDPVAYDKERRSK